MTDERWYDDVLSQEEELRRRRHAAWRQANERARAERLAEEAAAKRAAEERRAAADREEMVGRLWTRWEAGRAGTRAEFERALPGLVRAEQERLMQADPLDGLKAALRASGDYQKL